nr:ribosome assembly protein 4 [Nostoc sp. CreGUA01]
MTDSQQNEKGLQQLAWAIESSVGQFKLILARCNYAKLRDRLIQKLREICQVEIKLLVLQQSHRNLYTAIREEFGENLQGCVMVVGLETVQNIAAMLTSANQVREEFRKNFAFPLVLWIDDEIYKQLMQLAPDLESWATTRNFAISTQELLDFIIKTANQWFENKLNLSYNEWLKIKTELETAQIELLSHGQLNNLELEANLLSLLGCVNQIDNINLALENYQKSQLIWQKLNNIKKQNQIFYNIVYCHYIKCFKNRDKNHQDWQAYHHSSQEYIKFIVQSQRPDLIADSIFKFGYVLRDLKEWECLKNLAKIALEIHTVNNQPEALARDYAFLAEAALAQESWLEANQLIEKALEKFLPLIDGIQSINIQNFLPNTNLSAFGNLLYVINDFSFYMFIKARSLYHLGQLHKATSILKASINISNPDVNLKLYLDIVSFLQQLYFEQKAYLAAYETKQQQRSVEQQFGLRAFIGAGRLQATKQLGAIALAPLRVDNKDSIAPEIAASGRQLDVERLIERIGRPDKKLIVIHGQSGVGKSSLVNAGLVPALKNQAIGIQDNLPVAMRVYTNWVEELGRLLGSEGDEGDGEMGRWGDEGDEGDGEMGRWGDEGDEG